MQEDHEEVVSRGPLLSTLPTTARPPTVCNREKTFLILQPCSVFHPHRDFISETYLNICEFLSNSHNNTTSTRTALIFKTSSGSFFVFISKNLYKELYNGR